MSRVKPTIEGTIKIKEVVKKKFPSDKDFLGYIQEKCSKQQYYNFLKQVKIDETAADAIFQELDLDKEHYILSPHPLEYPDGRISLDSYFYLEPSFINSTGYEIIENKRLIRIKGPNLMGKSSLMDRIIHYAASQNYKTVYLDLNTVGDETLKDSNKFLSWFCKKISKNLKLDCQLNTEENYSIHSLVTEYFEDDLLPTINYPLVLALDNFERFFPYQEVRNNMFAMLRYWYEQINNVPIWEMFHLLIAHSTTDYCADDINYSPLNVGYPLELPMFNELQVLDLAQRHQLQWTKEVEIKYLMALVGGHPYLVRKAMYECCIQKDDIRKLLLNSHTESGIYSDHLRRLFCQLLNTPMLLETFQTIISSFEPVEVDKIHIFKLRSMGLIEQFGDSAIVSCELYRKYFSK